eukprot:11601-Pelagococcus_subviridis.AAC.1
MTTPGGTGGDRGGARDAAGDGNRRFFPPPSFDATPSRARFLCSSADGGFTGSPSVRFRARSAISASVRPIAVAFACGPPPPPPPLVGTATAIFGALLMLPKRLMTLGGGAFAAADAPT